MPPTELFEDESTSVAAFGKGHKPTIFEVKSVSTFILISYEHISESLASSALLILTRI